MYFCVHDFLYYLFAVYSKYLPTLCKGRYDSQAKKKPNIRYINEIYDQNHFLYFFSQMDFSNPHTYTHTHR